MKRLGSICLVLAACESDESMKVFNELPTVTITSHSEGASSQDGYTETFRAALTDPNHDTSELQAQWYLNSEVVCEWLVPDETGTSSCPMLMSAGTAEVLVEVRDPQDAGAAASLQVTVQDTDAPSVQITAPSPQNQFYSDQLVVFEALISDTEDLPEDLTIEWASSLDGTLFFDSELSSEGEWAGTHYLSEGEHALTLEVTDTSDKSTTQTVVVTVGAANSSPSCQLISPESESAWVFGDAISFIGEALDVDENARDLTVRWISDKDGEIGSSTPTSSGEVLFSTAALSVNTHTIAMEVEDERGEVCSDAILLTIGTAPSVVILDPVDGAVFDEGAPINFSAMVSDSESQPPSIALEWLLDNAPYSTQGPTSNGAVSVLDSGIAPGLHTLTINATDPDGLTASAMVLFTVNGLPSQPTVSISPNNPNTNDDLLATATGSVDPEGSNVTYVYDWFLNGTPTSYTGPNLPNSATSIGETWQVRATPNDGNSDGPAGTASLVIGNAPPSVTSVAIVPAISVFNDQTLTCSAVVSDPDQSLTPSYEWTSGGVTLGNSDTLSLSGLGVMPQDEVTCEVSVTDSGGLSASAQGSVVIDNRDPTIGTVSLTPSAFGTSETVTCNASVSDLDGETANVSFTWSVGGNTIGSGQSIVLDPSIVSPADVLSCSVVAADGYGGSSSASQSASILNTPPNLTVDIAESTAANTATLFCDAVASDTDDFPQAPSLTYSWENDTQGTMLGSSEYLTLDSSMAVDGDVVTCTVEATDLDGASVSLSDSVDIINSLPQVDSMSFFPSPLTSGTSAVQCQVTASDADQHPVSLSYEWQIDGVPQSSSSDSLMGPFQIGSEITCTATPNDGIADGNSQSHSELVMNSPPSVSTVSLNPDPAFTDDTISVSIVLQDSDPNQSLSASYEWHVVDAQTGVDDMVQSGSASSLSGASFFDKHDSIYVQITPYDGIDYGQPLNSSELTVSNTAPEPALSALVGIDSNTQSPNSQPLSGDDLQCFVSDVFDADYDNLTVVIDWTLNGLPWTGSTYDTDYAGDTIDGADVYASDLWTCQVTLTDSDGEISSSNVSSISVQSAIVAATCSDLLISMSMWGQAAQGVDLRAWTNSTLHFIGCNGNGCDASTFYCTDNSSSETLEFGSPQTLRASVDPGDANGDVMSNGQGGCCNGPLGLCNSFDGSNNGVGVNGAEALCHALGYASGVILSESSGNSCPEVHALTPDGLEWSSDFSSSQGHGNKYLCTGYR